MAGVSLSALGVNPDRLYHGQPSTAGTTLYTAPGTGTARTQVSSIYIANPSPSPVAVRLGLIPQGASEDGTHFLIGDQPIPANATLTLTAPVILRPGDILRGLSASLPAPSALAAVGSTTGGTLAAATYYYKVTGTNANGETAGSTEGYATTTGSTSSMTLTWTPLLGVTGYKVYRATTSGSEALLATLSGGTTSTYLDTGSATTAGAPPTIGTAAGCIYTILGAELPA